MNNVFNGVVFSDNDPRDYTISKFNAGIDIILDSEFCLKFPATEIILDQGDYNACVGHSFAICKSLLEYKATNKWIDFDPFMIYGTRYTGMYTGEGMYPNDGAKVLLNDGCWLRRNFGKRIEMPLLINEVNKYKNERPDLVKTATDHSISGYAIVRTVDETKRSLKTNMPVSACWMLYDSFYRTQPNGIVNMPKLSDVELGYHQMTIVGWRSDNKWIVLNSWGNNKGFRGVYYIPFNYRFEYGIGVSDDIIPSKPKAKNVTFSVNSNMCIVDGETKTLSTNVFEAMGTYYIPYEAMKYFGATIHKSSDDLSELNITSEENDIYISNSLDDNANICYRYLNNHGVTCIPIDIIKRFNCKCDATISPNNIVNITCNSL